MKLIFEDNENSPISRLLKRFLGEDVLFSSGNKNLVEFVNIALSIDKDVICFVDYVKDNYKTINAYLEVYNSFKNKIKLVKIPCIEIFAYMLLDYFSINRNFVNAESDILEYCIGKLDYITYPYYEQESFEKYIKALTEISPSCINTHGNLKNDRGKFYYSDCNCGDKYCRLTDRMISVSDKFRYLYGLLPLYYNEKGVIVFCKSFDWEEFYYRCNKIASNNILIHSSSVDEYKGI